MIKSDLNHSIIVIGSNGFIGSAFREYPAFIDCLFYEGKISSKEELTDICNNSDIVINCAAKGVYNLESKEVIHQVNADLPRWCIEWITEKSSRKYVHFGSWFEDRHEINSDYTQSKRKASSLIQSQPLKIRERILSIRLHHIYGFGEPADRLFPLIIYAIKNQLQVPLLHPEHTMNVVWKDDIPKLVYHYLKTDTPFPTDVINLRGDGPYTVQDIHDVASKVFINKSFDKKTELTSLEEGLFHLFER